MRGGALSRRLAKRFYVRQPFCPWVIRRIRPAAPPGELRRWFRRFKRLHLAGIGICPLVNPQELLRFFVRETMGGFQFGDVFFNDTATTAIYPLTLHDALLL